MRHLIALVVLSRVLQADDSEHHPGFIERGIGGVVNRAIPPVLDIIDLNAVVDQLDLDAIVAKLDLDAIVARLDLDALVDRLDLDALVDRLDLDAIVDRLDLDALVDRLDLDALVDRLDLDAIVSKLDLDAIVSRLDLDSLVGQIDIAPLVGKGSTEVAAGGLDLIRQQFIRIDVIVTAVVFRIFGREAAALPPGPGLEPLDAQTASDESSDSTFVAAEAGDDVTPALGDVQDDYAGSLSRLVAATIDSFGSVAVFGLLGAIAGFFVRFIFNDNFQSSDLGWFGAVLLALWLFGWYWLGQATTGRTPGKAVVGLKAVTRDGQKLGPGRALVRVLVLPISWLVAIFGFAGIVIGKERRALHDVAAGSTVIYDWGQRRAQLPKMRLVARNAPDDDTDDASGATDAA